MFWDFVCKSDWAKAFDAYFDFWDPLPWRGGIILELHLKTLYERLRPLARILNTYDDWRQLPTPRRRCDDCKTYYSIYLRICAVSRSWHAWAKTALLRRWRSYDRPPQFSWKENGDHVPDDIKWDMFYYNEYWG
jgi:hypothetical protein